MERTKKFPWFRLFYVLYILLLTGAVLYGLVMLWKFLAVYEASRPVHYMERALCLFERYETEQMQEYMVNTVENPYEDTDAMLSVFYDSVEGKKLSFGKLSGAYTEAHPVYTVLADDRQVATISFLPDQTDLGYNFNGWAVEKITLLVAPSKSFALTVPSSMNVTVNGIPVSEGRVVSVVKTDTPVDYVNYACSGELYLEPEIKVTDRYGAEVSLTKDEETGGLYYRLSYAKAPDSMELFFGGHVLGEENTLTENIEIEELKFIPKVGETFPEYAELEGLKELPAFREYFIDFEFDAASVFAKDRFGNKRLLPYEEETRTYSHELVSNDSLQAECIFAAKEFLEKYALFCTREANKEELEKFFPKNSSYYTTLVSMNNKWFNKHDPSTFKNHKLEEFFAYTDKLVYIHMTIEQEFRVVATNKRETLKNDVPLWLVKVDDKWCVARIIYTNNVEE